MKTFSPNSIFTTSFGASVLLMLSPNAKILCNASYWHTSLSIGACIGIGLPSTQSLSYIVLGGSKQLPGGYLEVRGGASATPSKSKGEGSSKSSKKKPKKAKMAKKNTEQAKKAIEDAMKEKDSAEALGDAIRDRADILRREDPFLQSIDWSVDSVGHALGASDVIMISSTVSQGGGVQAPPTSLIANYFLKSHGGAHWLQSLCSLLATASGAGAIQAASNQNEVWALIMLRRTMVFAMIKHVSGLLASASIAAQAVPKIGLSKSRKWMEEVVREPVAQYTFYTALMLLWLPKSLLSAWWWPRQRWVVSLLVTPVLLREVISSLLVISDCMVLWTVGSNGQDGVIEQIMNVSQSIVNAAMSLLVGPTKWRPANPAQRQAILAALISKLSLGFEAVIGVFLVLDVFLSFLFGLGGANQRPVWYEAITKLLVVRLFAHYLLWSRKKKLSKLAGEIRGGTVQLPFWVLDALYDPLKALGITTNAQSPGDESGTSFSGEGMTLKEFLVAGLGL